MSRLREALVAAAFLLSLVAPARALAQAGSVRTEVDARKIGVDDAVTLSIVLDGDAASLDAGLPTMKNLRVVAGPSTSTQISFINGSMSRQKILSYVLRGEKPGPAEISAISIQGFAPTAAIPIEVVPGSIRPAQQQQDPFGRDPFGGRDPFEELFGRPQRRQPVSEGKLFVEAVASRATARVGEPILVTYYVYTQISLSGVEFADAPKYPGFWAEEIDRAAGDSTGTNVAVQGEPFLRYPVLERLLFPTRAGTLEIPEARLRLVPSGGVFGVAAPIERGTKALRLKIEPLPKEASDTAAVGTYNVEASTDRTSLALGDALTFRFKISGRGNLKWIDAAPKLEVPSARIFPPRVVTDLRTTRQGVEGSKTWEFVIVPEKEGDYEIPAIPFPFFDPQTQSLRTERTQAIPIAVVAAANAPVTPARRGSTSAVSLRAELDAPESDHSRLATALVLASLLTHVLAWRRRRTRDAGPVRNPAAVGDALREIRGQDLLDGTKERATLRIAHALESVFGPRAEWPSDDSGDRLRSLADDLDFLRFAPQLGSYDTKLREVRDRAIAILEALR